MCRKFGKIWTVAKKHMHADRQTNRNTNTLITVLGSEVEMEWKDAQSAVRSGTC